MIDGKIEPEIPTRPARPKAKFPFLYMLDVIAERQGKKAEARENYGKFLDLRESVDPGLPEVEAAKKRLEAL